MLTGRRTAWRTESLNPLRSLCGLPILLISAVRTAFCVLAFAVCTFTGVTAGVRSEPEMRARPLQIGITHVIWSRALGEERRVNVVLPSGYEAGGKRRYPVLYLIDGGVEQDLLSIAGAVQSGAIWGRSADTIIVGIETKDRRKELVGSTTDPALRKRYPTAGGSAMFREFIRADVKSLMEKRYRTSGQDAVLGESLAGLFIVETFLKEPDLFDAYAAVDPSLWWDNGALSRLAAGNLGARQQDKHLLVAAAKEQLEDPEAYNRLVVASRRARTQICLLPRPDQTHATIYQQLAPGVLQFLLPPRSPPPRGFGFTLDCRP